MRKHTDYEDIMNLPNPPKLAHPRMSMRERAAQFAAFSALSGYEAVIQHTKEVNEEQYLKEDKEAWID